MGRKNLLMVDSVCKFRSKVASWIWKIVIRSPVGLHDIGIAPIRGFETGGEIGASATWALRS